ncbi:hypothetical protein [Cytobacillus firmus]|uniref:hypothetical protein n=1 Tax=Cytobacillus firmus TaxID=1399 RepID=UPI001CFECE76|nr:hypothetical protein [Cytobacillus firmus]
MYILQFINTYTQEILRIASYDDPIQINRMIEGFKEASKIDSPAYIIDNQRRTLNAEYVFHNVITEGNDTIYKVFFIVSLAEMQAKIVD